MHLEHSVLSVLASQPDFKRWVIAYSGGLDSSVLLHLVVKVNQQLANPKAICALHINHQLSPNAGDWQQHCQQQAAQWSVDFIANKVDVETSGHGVEAAARDARYRIFENFLQVGDCLLLGHHRDDQSETFLLRLFRGAGVLGLAAMPFRRVVGHAQLLRPLLNVERDQLLTYAQAHQLTWIEDESNHSLDYDRNYVRHQVMPTLTSRWQQVKKQLAHAAERLQKAQQLLDDLASIDLQRLSERRERYGYSIDWQMAKKLELERISNVIRYWCSLRGFSSPDAQQLQQIHEQFFSRNAMLTSALVRWGNIECRQFNRRLYLMVTLEPFQAAPDPVSFLDKKCIDLGVAGRLTFDVVIDQGEIASGTIAMNRDVFMNGMCNIRWRTGGERCTPANREKSQTIKKLLQEYQLETWLRDRVPMLYIDNELAAVGDLWVCKGYEAETSQSALRVHWELD